MRKTSILPAVAMSLLVIGGSAIPASTALAQVDDTPDFGEPVVPTDIPVPPDIPDPAADTPDFGEPVVPADIPVPPGIPDPAADMPDFSDPVVPTDIPVPPGIPVAETPDFTDPLAVTQLPPPGGPTNVPCAPPATRDGLPVGGERRRHLLVRGHAVLRFDRCAAVEPADRGDGVDAVGRRLLVGRERRRHLLVRRRAVLRFDGCASA